MNIDEISLASLQESAHKYRKDLVRLPVISLESSTQFMTVRPGIQGKETFYNPEFEADFAPYATAERTKTEGSFNPRTIETFFGACFFDFDPNTVISSILGHKASQAGNGAATTVAGREVCASVVKNLGRKLNRHLFSAKRNPAGKTTADLFDGFDTITDAEIAAGNISEEKGNLIVLKEAITAQNAVDVIKQAIFAANDELREEDCFVYTSRSIVDLYNESYLMSHSGLVYNEEYKQTTIEGSDGRMTFAPMVGKKGSKYIHICPKANMIVGVDQMSDKERFEVNRYEPKLRTGELYMYLGTQFESIDPRRMLVIQLPD
ncbi:MAG: hypothetical protein HDR49_01410 [Bacteroides sp.]|nr:hypothetical protein [Bacteroides sp.]